MRPREEPRAWAREALWGEGSEDSPRGFVEAEGGGSQPERDDQDPP